MSLKSNLMRHCTAPKTARGTTKTIGIDLSDAIKAENFGKVVWIKGCMWKLLADKAKLTER